MVGTYTPGRTRLSMLSDEQATVVAAEDVRGFDVDDASSRRIGTVDDLVVDGSGRVRFLKVGAGGLLGLGRSHRLVPVDLIESVGGETVFLKTTKDRVTDGPEWEPVDDETYIQQVCAYYGCLPFWSEGYRPPDWSEQA